MRVFIVHAHPEPQSFNGAMTATARAALEAAGHVRELGPLPDGLRSGLRPIRYPALADYDEHYVLKS
ncbi:MAG: NAD(P)H-dependent oxidoreductase [Rhodospirillaceae bacterium]|nr:NAD(P)H-dependent oxidoreductase [Rhodospirillaceae bacterium]